ncbi:uncharacterized protein [Rutidosis leptorrhynchoides]|uniref:uncharacterized protein n=1 Tax=Rutidosis leptorrhynchoides TaxID=125765 RepID=UPI003A99525C
MRKLMWSKGNIHERVRNTRKELEDIQIELDKHPNSHVIRLKESEMSKLLNEAVLDEERFLKQKAKIEWLRVGDSNTGYFHKVVQGKIHRSKIHSVVDFHGLLHEGVDVPGAFVNHYAQFLGQASNCAHIANPESLFIKQLPAEIALGMVLPVSASEVRDAVFNIGDGKLRGPDGYSTAFFKKSWDIVGNDVVKAVIEFFCKWLDSEGD